MKSSKILIAKIAGLMALALALIAAGLFLITRDDSPARKLLHQGNDAYAEQNYLDALGAYELAQGRQPELAEPFYNAANALYREGSFGDAIVQIQQALLNVEDEDLAQNSFYNMGNAAYNGQDMESAIQSFIDALLINPNDADAKYNLELALQQQQEQEQQEQEQEQESEESGDSEQSEDSESQDGEEGEENEEQQDSNSEDGEGEEESEESKDGQGEESDEESDQEQDEQDSAQDGEGEDDEQEQPDQGNGQPQEGNPSDPTENGMVPQPGERLTEEQARQLLMSLAQGSGTLQERLQQIYISPLPPPAQDW